LRRSISDRIEQYLKVLINRSDAQQIEIQRAELAETFSCVPSQVTYVLSTRFNGKDGYITESRRGGKGFVRITHVSTKARDCSHLHEDLQEMIAHMLEDRHMQESEARFIKYLLPALFEDMDEEQQQLVLTSMIKAIVRYNRLQSE
jgi:transcriptional regulator CtsR